MGSLRKAAKNYNNRERWDAPFTNDQFKIPEGRATKTRLGEDISQIPHHWVEFVSEKKKGTAGFYALCLNWDYENEEAADNGCPMCELDIRVTNYTYGYVIHRAEQRKGNLQIRPIRLTPKCTNDILKLTDIAYPDEEWPEGWESEEGEGPDATDAKFGFDIMISMDKNKSKTEYPVHVAQDGIKPLTAEEKKAFRAYAKKVNFAALAAASLPSVAEVKKDLARLGLLGEGASAKKAKNTNYEAYDDVPEDDAEEEDDDPVVESPRKKKAKKKTAKKKTRKVQSITGDDEDEDEDEEEGRALPWDDEDEDEEDSPSRNYATADEDDAPEDDEDEYEEDDED